MDCRRRPLEQTPYFSALMTPADTQLDISNWDSFGNLVSALVEVLLQSHHCVILKVRRVLVANPKVIISRGSFGIRQCG